MMGLKGPRVSSCLCLVSNFEERPLSLRVSCVEVFLIFREKKARKARRDLQDYKGKR